MPKRQKEEPSRVRRLFTENLPEKVFSILLALALWGYVTGQEKIEMGFVVPLETTKLPPKLEITSPLPRSVTLRLRGAPGRLNSLKPSDVRVLLNLKDLTPGVHDKPITEKDVILPEGITLVSVIPPSIEITCGTLIEREVPVVVKWRTPPSKHLKIRVVPPKVKVKGVSTLMEKVRAVATYPIEIPKGDFEKRVISAPLEPPVPGVPGIHMLTTKVQVVLEKR